MKSQNEIIVDNFAGGGGASTGIVLGAGRNIDYAINHDREAIAMHRANHPETKHFQTNVWDINPKALAAGRPVGLAWFSPDCTFHSKARGSKPFRSRDKARRQRGLAGLVPRWGAAVRPRIIMMENVEEFADWGPLNADGSICKLRKGMNFRRWVRQLENLGYAVDMRELRASDYGTPTSRKRLFVVARCDGADIVFPEATHGYGLIPYRTAAECIDWSIPCPSIFDRQRPLVEATMRRIARGVMRYVINNADPFIVPITHHGDVRVHDINEPLRTITTANRGELALVSPTLVQIGWGEREGQAPRSLDIHKPLGTIMAGGNKHALVCAFLAQHNTGMTGHPANKPLSTIVGRGTQQQLVTSHIIKLKGTCRDGQPVDAPLHTIQAGGQHYGEVRAFLLKYYGTDQDPRLDYPMATVTTKARFGIVMVHGEPYAITDIGMRMLSPGELFRAQGFDNNYIIDRGIDEFGDEFALTKTSQIRMCGNSVCPPIAKALVESNFHQMEKELVA